MTPPMLATSPTACTLLSEVCCLESTLMPPRPPSSMPASFASSSLGRTPAETQIMPASITLSTPPSEILRPMTPSGPTRTSSGFVAVCTLTFNCSTLPFNIAPPTGSTCTGMRCGAISTMSISKPKS